MIPKRLRQLCPLSARNEPSGAPESSGRRTAEKLLREPEVLEDTLDPRLLGLKESRELI
jgi:hypothetical protein